MPKICWLIQISGDCIGYWALRWQRHSETTAISILCSKQAANLHFPMFKCSWKRTFSFLFVRPCMHHNYGVISGSHACRDCGWHIILVAELYTTSPGERVLAATKFNVTFLPLRLCYVNTSTCFSKDAENLTTYGYVIWCSQIVGIRHYSLNTITAFCSVIEWSNFAVSAWSMACQATMLPHFTWNRPMELAPYSAVVLKQVLRDS